MGISKFEIADYLDSKEMIAEYLNTALEEGDNDDYQCNSSCCKSYRND